MGCGGSGQRQVVQGTPHSNLGAEGHWQLGTTPHSDEISDRCKVDITSYIENGSTEVPSSPSVDAAARIADLTLCVEIGEEARLCLQQLPAPVRLPGRAATSQTRRGLEDPGEEIDNLASRDKRTAGNDEVCTWHSAAKLNPSREPMGKSPTMETMSDKTLALVAQMRVRIEALPPDQAVPQRHDLWLKRFLTHASWKLEKALQLYVEMEAWRRKVDADNILGRPVSPQLQRNLHIDLMGFYPFSTDAAGRLVGWMRMGHTPWWRSLFETTEAVTYAQTWMHEFSNALVARRAKETGLWMERGVVLVDLRDLDFAFFQNFSGSSRVRRRAQLQTVSQYYPGMVDKVFIVNAPSFISRAWTMCKMILSKQLMDKAVLVLNDKQRQQMLDELGAENVPRDLGGTAEAPSIDLPEPLRLPPDGWSSVLQEWRPRELTLPGGTHDIVEVLAVPTSGCARWQWTLAYSGVTFEVLSRSGQGSFETACPPQEYIFNDLEDPVCGELALPAGGEVKLVWHTFGWRAKTLLLRFEVA